jgi:hypothetical protein
MITSPRNLSIPLALAMLLGSLVPVLAGDTPVPPVTAQTLREIRIPEIKLFRVSLEDAFIKLQTLARKHDPEGRQITIRYERAESPASSKPLMMDLRDVSLKDALDSISRMKDLHYTVEDGVVVVRH